jgi:hypothetical protein
VHKPRRDGMARYHGTNAVSCTSATLLEHQNRSSQLKPTYLDVMVIVDDEHIASIPLADVINVPLLRWVCIQGSTHESRWTW